jgi:hypothetical protein
MSMLKMPPGRTSISHFEKTPRPFACTTLEVFRFRQRFPDELFGTVDEPFEDDVEFRTDRPLPDRDSE